MKKKIYVNVSFDDLHPEEGWGNINDNVMIELLNLKKKFPEIKYTFYTTPNYSGKYENRLISFIKRRLHLLGIKNDLLSFSKCKNDLFNISKYKDWCNYINYQVDIKFFEIGVHGYNHYNPFITPTAEFEMLSKEDSEKKIDLSIKLFSDNNIKITPTFRPPAWGINKSLKEILIQKGFKYLSLNSKQINLEYDTNNKIFNIPQNYSIESDNYNLVLNHLERNNFLFIKGHLYSKLENGIKKNTVNNIVNILDLLQNKFTLSFIFINEIEELYLNNKIGNVYKI